MNLYGRPDSADQEEKAVNSLICELDIAERKAWDSLSRYKFVMFGYWAGVWVHLNRISNLHRSNPWKELVKQARGLFV